MKLVWMSARVVLLILVMTAAGSPAAGQVLFEGTVRDMNGDVVAQVDLDWYDPVTGRAVDPRADSTASDNTDPFGRYSVQVTAGVYDVRYAPPRFRTDIAPVRVSDVDLTADRTMDVTLPAGSRLSGTVRTAGGSPVPGVDLDLVDVATGIRAPTVYDDTATDGTYGVTVVPGVYDIIFEPPLGSGTAALRVTRFDLTASGTLDVTLPEGFLVAGLVTDSGGTGIGGVDLDIDDRTTRERVPTPGDVTYDDGSFILGLPAGNFDVIAMPPPGSAFAPSVMRDVTIAATTSLPPIVLVSGVVLSGSVLGPDGSALQGANLDLYLPGTDEPYPIVGGVTDAAGSFAVRVEPRAYDILVQPVDSPVAPAWFRGVSVTSDTTVTLAFPAAAPEQVLVATLILDPEGAGVPGVRVLATPVGGGAGWEAISAPDGSVSVWVLPGDYDLELDPPAGSGLVPASIEGVVVPGGFPSSIVLDRTPAPPGLPSNAMRIAPNPAAGEARIALTVAADVPAARLDVFDMAGRLVATLHRGALTAGSRQFEWSGDASGRRAPAGVYFVRFDDGATVSTRKLVKVP